MDTGAVRAVVQQTNNMRPGDTARDPRTPARSSSARHGSAEHGSNPRQNRSREPRERDSRGRSTNTRDLPQVTLGPQNTIDLGQQFEDVHDRLDALERLQRLHATSITHADQAISENRAAINVLDTDISAYKLFITKTHKVIDEYVATKNLEIGDAIRT